MNNLENIMTDLFSREYNNRLIYPHTPTHSQKELVVR